MPFPSHWQVSAGRLTDTKSGTKFLSSGNSAFCRCTSLPEARQCRNVEISIEDVTLRAGGIRGTVEDRGQIPVVVNNYPGEGHLSGRLVDQHTPLCVRPFFRYLDQGTGKHPDGFIEIFCTASAPRSVQNYMFAPNPCYLIDIYLSANREFRILKLSKLLQFTQNGSHASVAFPNLKPRAVVLECGSKGAR